MQINTIIRRILKILTISLSLIVFLIAILSFTNLSIPLDGVRSAIVSKASKLAGQEVHIDGQIRLAISFFPTLVVDHLRISNAPGWSSTDILSITEARVQLALLPLLSGNMEFIDISVSDVQINLEQARDGRQNWADLFRTDDQSSTDTGDGDVWVDEFSLTDLVINYSDEALNRTFATRIDWLLVNTHDKTQLSASLEGHSQNDSPYSFTASSDLLRNLVDNKPWKMNIQGEIANKPVNMDMLIDPDNPEQNGHIKLDAKEVQLGYLLELFGLVDDLNFYSQSISFEAKLNGNNLINILEKSTFSVQMEKGYLQPRNPANNADSRHQKIVFNSAKLQSLLKDPVSLNFTGDVGGSSMELALTTNKLSDLFRAESKIHLEINANIAQSTIQLKGDIAPPIKHKNFNMDILISGEKLSQWNELITLHFPSYGPYTLKGNIKSTVDGIALNKVKLNIGSSDLSGEILIKTQNEITHWDIRLNSEKIQISDFLKKDIKLSPHTETPPDEDAESQRNETETKIAETNTTVTKDEAIQREVRNTEASQVTGKITLKAKEVLAGEDKLGYGELTIQFTDTIFSVDHFKLDTPGGSIKGAFALKKDNDEISGDFKLDVEKFDYGHIGRLIQSDSSNDGLLSVRVDLQLKGKDTNSLLDQANGVIDFAIWPKNIKADQLNIWSANLFFALLPVLEKKESTLNCATALLDIKDGVLTEELIFIDTTKLWMNGNVNINYPEEKVALALFPTAKKRKLFGLQLPIRLEGSFADVGVAIKPFDLVKAYLSFVTSPLHAPFQRMFTTRAEENLSQLCGDLLDREFLKALQKDLNKNVPSLDEMYE